MAFTLIIGPMKSGKSLELIARVAPYEFASKKVLYVQPKRDVRGKGISSRAGLKTKAIQVSSLSEVSNNADVIGIDEVHMFPANDVDYIQKWLQADKELIISGLDVDYSGSMTPIVKKILELKPDIIIDKLAVCEACQQYTAKFTQILRNDKPILEGLPSVVPEDGTYVYQARCRNCFVKQ